MFAVAQNDVARKRTAPPSEEHRRAPLPLTHNPLWDAFATSSHAAGPPRMQAKLAISQPGDPSEQEADRVADQVMRIPEPTVQRTCAGCEIGSAPCPTYETEQGFMLHRKVDAASGPSASSDATGLIAHLGPGQPLDPGTRAFFEPRFGQDFSSVRVHTDTQAAESAQFIHAQAYALGQDVVFGEGQYTPETAYGQRLLAHELTHVVQQSDSPPLQTQSFANSSLTRQSVPTVLSRAKLHTDKDLFDMMQKFRSKNDHLSETQQNKIFWSIKKATDSDEVAYKFFDYFSGWFGNKILLMTPAEEANAKKNDTLAETPSGGDTKLRSDVFTMPDETLGPLLLHEFAHTGHHVNFMGAYDFEEGQAYGIEYHYAERTGDSVRMTTIISIISNAAARWGANQKDATQQNFKVTYALMCALADLTKSGSSTLPPLIGKDGEDGRVMASEFVSDFRDMSKDLSKLWDYILKNLPSFKLPAI